MRHSLECMLSLTFVCGVGCIVIAPDSKNFIAEMQVVHNNDKHLFGQRCKQTGLVY